MNTQKILKIKNPYSLLNVRKAERECSFQKDCSDGLRSIAHHSNALRISMTTLAEQSYGLNF